MIKMNLIVIILTCSVTNAFSMGKELTFWNAIYDGKTNLIESMLKQDKYLLNIPRLFDNKLPLPFVAQCGNVVIAQILIKYGATDKVNALFLAAVLGHIKVSKLLLENEVSINYYVRKAGREYTPLNIAIAHGHYKYVKWLMKKGANFFCKESPLYSWSQLYSECYYGPSKKKIKADKLLLC